MIEYLHLSIIGSYTIRRTKKKFDYFTKYLFVDR